MTISIFGFIDNEVKQLHNFAEWWLNHNHNNSSLFPYYMKPQDFKEQYEFYLDMQFPGRKQNG